MGLCCWLSCPFSEKLKEDDYNHITDDPSVPAAMEVDQVTRVLEGEAGRSSGEVNKTSVKTILTQDEPQTRLPLEKENITVFASHSESSSGIQSFCLGYYLLSSINVLLVGKYVQLILFFSVVSVYSMYSSAVWNERTGQRTTATGSREVKNRRVSDLVIVPAR